MKNIFNYPKENIEKVNKIRIQKENRKDFNSKSLICVWLTKICPVQCKDCFCNSNLYYDGILDERYQFSSYGVKRLIEFINASNNSYLMISGGGEPMVRHDIVNEIIRKCKTERIVVITSGVWAKTESTAEKIIDKLYESYKSRKDEVTFILRLSVDSFHYKPLGFDVINNIIKVFRSKYSKEKNFRLSIHTMQNDSTLESVLNRIDNTEIICDSSNFTSDNDEVSKISPQHATVRFLKDGYEFKVSYAKLYFSIIAIKDYLKEGILSEDDISFLSDDIKSIINLPITEIQKLYNESNYDIIKQYFEKKEILRQIDWDILFTLIRLGHYKVYKTI